MRVTIEAGVRLYQALADWAEWTRTLPAPPAPAPAPAPAPDSKS
ncbi:hypothetical protein Misp01_51420 [Microtetraspora sp. NBRC 13810]|nr:hypothetical protein [Microtetraspora sp. NBRC 13810]GLW10013.1 hypothetical protein Misp01_51420 [Microtetraspora sp. NBRC 13810]